MPLKDPAQFTHDELAQEVVINDRAADDAAARPEIASLTNAEITELLPSVTDEATRDALVKVMWTRAAQQATATCADSETPR